MNKATLLRKPAIAVIAMTVFGSGAVAQAPTQPLSLEDVVVRGAAARQAFERNLLRLDVAEKIAKSCFSYAEENDFATAVHIVDQFGYTIYAARMDGRTADNIESAELKAGTALYFRESTRVWAERSSDNALMPHLLGQMGQFPAIGGLPIIVEDQLLGAIGVGGATSDQDEDCARAALVEVLGAQPNMNGGS